MAYIPDQAIDRMSELSAGAWRFYCFLARCRNQKTGKCCPSIMTTAEAIAVHPKNVFKLRNELASTRWAQFDGNNVISLFGFNGSVFATADVAPIGDRANGSKNATIGPGSKNATNGCKNTTTDVAPIGDRANGSKNATIPFQTNGSVFATNGSKNATPIKEEPAKEPAKKNIGARAPDPRADHVAIQTCRKITDRYPPKGIWNKIIRTLGDEPKQDLLVECYEAWLERGYSGNAWCWATEWYTSGVPVRNGADPKHQNSPATVGASKKTTEKQLPSEVVNAEMLRIVNELIDSNDLVHLAYERDLILARGDPKAEWELRCVGYFDDYANGSEPDFNIARGSLSESPRANGQRPALRTSDHATAGLCPQI